MFSAKEDCEGKAPPTRSVQPVVSGTRNGVPLRGRGSGAPSGGSRPLWLRPEQPVVSRLPRSGRAPSPHSPRPGNQNPPCLRGPATSVSELRQDGLQMRPPVLTRPGSSSEGRKDRSQRRSQRQGLVRAPHHTEVGFPSPLRPLPSCLPHGTPSPQGTTAWSLRTRSKCPRLRVQPEGVP